MESDTDLLHVSPKGLPDWSRVTWIEASHFDPAEAWATVGRRRMDEPPAATLVQAGLGKGLLLEVEAIAVIPEK